MSTIRFKALQETFNRKPVVVEEAGRRSELFGQNVFNEASNASVYDQRCI